MSEANIAMAQTLYSAFVRGDIETILQGCTPDIEWEAGGRSEDFPTFGRRKGIEQVAEFFRIVAKFETFNEFSPREFYADRDKVFALGRYTITLKTNGRRIASEWIHVITFRGSKVAKFREFTDTASFAAAYRD
jgi:uncharacterized protein